MTIHLLRNTETGEFFLPKFQNGGFVIGWTSNRREALQFQRDTECKRVDRSLKAEIDRKVSYLASEGFQVEVVAL